MRIGIIRTSYKENEKRVPIYPEHLNWIAPDLRDLLVFESNYGEDYGFSNDYFTKNNIHMASRQDIFRTCDLLILPKPVLADLEQMKEHQILWGWVHCVQGRKITQTAIDRKLTLIAWEAMHQWSSAGERLMHIFYKNNEIAGYAAVLHILELLGIDGHYGPRRHVIVIGYGSVSRGAIYALQGRGFNNIHVYTRRPVYLVADQNPDVYYHHLEVSDQGQLLGIDNDGTVRPFIDELAKAEIICNGVLQDTDKPLMFVDETNLVRLKPRSLVIDISCDEGMGFSFARPTTFDDPIFSVGENITYYSVDHTPSYLWNAASREISRAVLAFLPTMAKGRESWIQDEIVRKAIEIDNGVIQNPKILSFQNRESHYPHGEIFTTPSSSLNLAQAV
jgi:alanine dehydrogenase